MTTKKIILSEYQEDVHRTGRIMYLITYGFIILMPVGACIYFGVWPKGSELLKALLGVVPTFWPVGFIEAFTYMPMLGGSGSYLSFITGNVTNMKVPAALQAMESAKVKQGTEEGEIISTIAVAISSLTTLFIIVLFVLLLTPLEPVLTNPILAPAFSNVLPALFGGLMVAFLSRDPKVGVPVVLFSSILFIVLPIPSNVCSVLSPVFVLIAVGLARLLYKKGKLD